MNEQTYPPGESPETVAHDVAAHQAEEPPAAVSSPAPTVSAGTEDVAPVAGPRPRTWPMAAVIVAIVVSLIMGTAGGFAGGYLAFRQQASMISQYSDTEPANTDEEPAAQTVNAATDPAASAAAAAQPSVVSISVTGGGSSGTPDGLPGGDRFSESEGSGVAYRAADDGGTYVITNQHVVEDASTVVVTDYDGDSYEAEVVGSDASSDIAVLYVAESIPVVTIGNSDDLVIGQFVVAIGSPFGLEQTVTSGIVSALHRTITESQTTGEYPYVDAIQTDAAINPGNSGGALVDSAGQLIGIPSAIYSASGSSAGVGIAIPAERAVQAADDLIGRGAVETPYLGVLGQDVTDELADAESLPVSQGAYVIEVTPESGAAAAGLRAGDIIVAMDDDRIRDMDDLILSVRQRSVGDQVQVSIYRSGTQQTLTMTIGAKPAADTE